MWLCVVVRLQCQTCPTGLVFSPDGKLMATLAKDRKVCQVFSLNLKIKCRLLLTCLSLYCSSASDLYLVQSTLTCLSLYCSSASDLYLVQSTASNLSKLLTYFMLRPTCLISYVLCVKKWVLADVAGLHSDGLLELAGIVVHVSPQISLSECSKLTVVDRLGVWSTCVLIIGCHLWGCTALLVLVLVTSLTHLTSMLSSFSDLHWIFCYLTLYSDIMFTSTV